MSSQFYPRMLFTVDMSVTVEEYGVVVSMNSVSRLARVRWMFSANGDSMYVHHMNCFQVVVIDSHVTVQSARYNLVKSVFMKLKIIIGTHSDLAMPS